MMGRLFGSEPILVLLAGGTGLMTAIFQVLAAFGYPLTDAQQHALAGLAVAVGAFIARAFVVSPATHQSELTQQQNAQKLGV